MQPSLTDFSGAFIFVAEGVKMQAAVNFKILDINSKASFSPIISKEFLPKVVADSDEYVIFPGFCDVHVHFREPGFSYKETIYSGSRAAAHGGYTAVCTMPNLSPVPDNIEHLNEQLKIIEKDAAISVYPYGSITVAQLGKKLSDMGAMADKVIAYSDDGRGVQDEKIMRQAMKIANSLGKVIVAHCEDNSLLKCGYIHDGIYARANGHKGICSESEWKPIERDLRLAKETGCAYHICHISCKESVELIRKAKALGVNVTCETAPHYLILDENDLRESGNFKMNPPLRSREDRLALIDGVKDGTIDMIATDHAPHSKEEKSKGLKDSAFGIVGIEIAFPLLYTKLVKEGIITLDKLIEVIAINPRRRFNIPLNNDDYTVWNLGEEITVDSNMFLSKGKSMPFDNMNLYGKCYLTVANGKIAYKSK